jgi:hypothetical protein
MMKQAQENASAAAKTSYVPPPVKQEPTFTSPIVTTAGFNGTSAAEVKFINGKPAPQPAPQPEI